MFNLYADLISFHLNAFEQIAFTEARLAEEHKTAELREQFIAILGHDLRNPVGAILNCAQLLVRMKLDEKSVRLANIIQDSSFRINGLIDNILDFARGRLGEGIIINSDEEDKLDIILNQVIAEMRAIWPDHIIKTRFKLAEPVNCDGKRIAQLFSNILGNALTHGKADTPVKVEAISGDGEFKLSVFNYGDKIPAATMDRLFQPFSRGEFKSGQGGLGLGLYIANEIARAHGGKIEVLSTSEETCFTYSMPAR
jgi:signal transduction histidine kinase